MLTVPAGRARAARPLLETPATVFETPATVFETLPATPEIDPDEPAPVVPTTRAAGWEAAFEAVAGTFTSGVVTGVLGAGADTRFGVVAVGFVAGGTDGCFAEAGAAGAEAGADGRDGVAGGGVGADGTDAGAAEVAVDVVELTVDVAD